MTEVNEAAIGRMETVATLLDSGIELPGVGIRVGIDPIIGLLPGAGDVVAGLISLYIVAEAALLGVSAVTLARMVFNIAVDTAIGTVPVLGDLFDVVWRANDKNVELAKRDLGVE